MSKKLDLDAEVLDMLNTKADTSETEVQLTAEQMEEMDTPMSEEEMAKPELLLVLVTEIKAAAARAIDYKQNMDEAQTSTKREHYRKKLVRNNEEAADMLLALERITQVRDARESLNNEARDIIQNGPREESSN